MIEKILTKPQAEQLYKWLNSKIRHLNLKIGFRIEDMFVQAVPVLRVVDGDVIRIFFFFQLVDIKDYLEEKDWKVMYEEIINRLATNDAKVAKLEQDIHSKGNGEDKKPGLKVQLEDLVKSVNGKADEQWKNDLAQMIFIGAKTVLEVLVGFSVYFYGKVPFINWLVRLLKERRLIGETNAFDEFSKKVAIATNPNAANTNANIVNAKEGQP